MGSCKRYHLKIVDVGLGRIVMIEMRGVTVRIFPTYLFDGSCLQSWESSLNWESGGMSPIWARGVVACDEVVGHYRQRLSYFISTIGVVCIA